MLSYESSPNLEKIIEEVHSRNRYANAEDRSYQLECSSYPKIGLGRLIQSGFYQKSTSLLAFWLRDNRLPRSYSITSSVLKNVYDNVMLLIFASEGSSHISGSMKKRTGISISSLAFSLCSSKQKH